MDYFPLFVDLKDKSCLVVGGGEIALRKTKALLSANANVQVVSDDIHPELKELASIANLEFTKQLFQTECLEGKYLVIAATSDRKLNELISISAKAQNIPVNVVDNPDLCSFIFPAIIEREPITIAVCSNGHAPVLGRLLRAKIESIIPFQYGKLAELAKKYRNKVKQVFSNTNQRRSFWESIFEGKVAQDVFNNKLEQAEARLVNKLNNAELTETNSGEVYLVGAGPGDPELLTFKALRLMQQADVVFYDRLVSPAILDMTRRDATKIYVGKKSHFHCVPQNQINALLIEYALKGCRVLRLKGGDPFIFGRGGEEAEALVEQKIPFQMVPGITSAAGASNYCGIPLTHRDYSHSVTFVTGHLKNNSLALNWQALAQANQTLVIYMGLSGLAKISEKLQQHGLSSQTPVAVIHKATTDEQQVVVSDLINIEKKVKQSGITSPALIIVGEVVKLREILTNQNQTQLDYQNHKNLALERVAI